MLKMLPLWTTLVIFTAMLACTAATPVPIPTETPAPSATAAATPTPAGSPAVQPTSTPAPTSEPPIVTASPEGVTWVLRTLDGEPALDGTFLWMRLDGNEYGGLDGCNTFGGRHQDGKPVASADGGFDAPPGTFRTAIGCEIPHGILEQADRYIELLRQGQRFRALDDRLAILGGDGEERLVFARQTPLAGQPVELADTAWRLMAEDSTDTGVRAATLVFLDERHAVGITACRGYVAAYEVSGERLNSYAKSMTEYETSECAEEARRQEGQFTTDLSRAIEYAVSQEDGTRRLRIRTSRGRTLTFEPLEAKVEGMFGVEWRLTATLDMGQTDPDRNITLRTYRLAPGTEVTARFDQGRCMSGFDGCTPYGAKLEPEETFAKEDGTFATGLMVIASTSKGCPDLPGVKEQEQRFRRLIPQFERYRIYGELLVIHTSEDVVLLFHQSGADALEQRGHCLDAKTNEELEHIRDADGVLWPVAELPGDHTSCAVPWEVAVDTDGRVIVVVHLDENGKETEALGRLAEWVYHPRTGERIHTAPHAAKVVRLEGYKWHRK